MKPIGNILINLFIILQLCAVIFCGNNGYAANITVQFTAPGDDGNEGIATAYLVYYSTQPFDSLNYGQAETASFCAAPDTAGTIQTCTLTGLLSDTQYWIGIRTVDEAGNWSGMSNIITARTPDIVAPAAIIDLRAI